MVIKEVLLIFLSQILTSPPGFGDQVGCLVFSM